MTTSLVSYGGSGNISTHILTKRMTRFSQLWWVIHRVFQLTSSRRGWRVLCHYWHNLEIFQLTSSRRGWLCTLPQVLVSPSFQLTSSRRGWRMSLNILQVCFYFNSHPHEEDDMAHDFDLYAGCISTHILTKRMTHSDNPQVTISTFQLTSSRRGWHYEVLCYLEKKIFQLTSSRRGWPTKHQVFFQWYIFQLTSSRRGWQDRWAYANNGYMISTHILTKRMTIPLTHGWNRCFISTHILTKRMTCWSAWKVELV